MTAVEWLYETLWKQNDYSLPSNILEKAKEMERQHIVSAFEIGYENGACTNENESIYHGSNYYNKTFKSK